MFFFDFETWSTGLYGNGGATAGVDTSIGLAFGLFEEPANLVGEYQEIEIGILAGSGGVVLDENGKRVGGTFTLGPGLPASGRYTNGEGVAAYRLGPSSLSLVKPKPIIVECERKKPGLWKRIKNFLGRAF